MLCLRASQDGGAESKSASSSAARWSPAARAPRPISLVPRSNGAMLDVLVANVLVAIKAILFGMDSDRWNFAIYLYDSAPGTLDCIACRRTIRAKEEAPHRSCEAGEGHVGIAFQMRREIVAADTSEPEARALFDALSPLRREDDLDRYRSIASIPIRLVGNEPVGILVATSDVRGRFWLHQREEDTAREPVEPLRILANALALVIKTAELYKEAAGSPTHGRTQS
jgi:GAF domain-containing protein